MTLAALQTSVWSKLSDDGTFYQASDVLKALNQAQRMFVFLTLCLEATEPFVLNPGVATYRMLALFPDYIILRRMILPDGSELAPSTLAELDALDPSWLASPGEPLRIADEGLDFLAITPQPTATMTASVVYARCPVALAVPADVPEIRVASHEALANYAACALRQPEGAQELAKFASYTAAFLEEAGIVAELVKARSVDAGYERMPAQLKLGDKSRGKR